MASRPNAIGAEFEWRPTAERTNGYSTIAWAYDAEIAVLSYSIRPDPRPSFTERVLRDLAAFQADIKNGLLPGAGAPVEFLIASSSGPQGECLGGDLEFFLQAVRAKQRQALSAYARRGVAVLYENYTGLDRGITTLAMLRGATLGAGFEAALSCDVIVAERGIKVGFPEVLFNMFPGMGAMSFLSRRIPPSLAERMITTGKLYSAEELQELGLIDYLVDAGKAGERLPALLRALRKSRGTRVALARARARVSAISLEELEDISDIWVDTALQLPESDLVKVERLLLAQNQKSNQQRGARSTH